jgi:AraC family transcriptional regulator, positive regulator of tynA and feaB
MSTANIPPHERLSFWNDTCMGAYGAMVVDTEPGAFQGVLTMLSAGGLQVLSVKSTPAVCRTSYGATQNRSDETAFSLQLVHSGQCRIHHAGHSTIGMPGDMFIADSSKHYELAFADPVHGIVLSPPWARFNGYAEKLEALAGRPLNVRNGPGAVLSGFIRSAWDELLDSEDEAWPESATELIWDLLESALQGDTGRATVTGRADKLRRDARALIDDRLADTGFTSADLPVALGVSARYLQMVFAEVGTTPSRFLIARRLDVAAARLRRLDRPCSVTDVALECGFNDLSYFSRAFRRRFGLSASAYRLSFGAKSVDWR